MFLSISELKTHLADYQVDQITGSDDSIVTSAIDTAVAEVRSFLANRYDVSAIFSASGSQRSPLVLEHVKIRACYHLLLLANVDASYERFSDAYDRSSDFLRKVADGLLSPDLPYTHSSSRTPPGTLNLSSNPKFHHHF